MASPSSMMLASDTTTLDRLTCCPFSPYSQCDSIHACITLIILTPANASGYVVESNNFSWRSVVAENESVASFKARVDMLPEERLMYWSMGGGIDLMY